MRIMRASGHRGRWCFCNRRSHSPSVSCRGHASAPLSSCWAHALPLLSFCLLALLPSLQAVPIVLPRLVALGRAATAFASVSPFRKSTLAASGLCFVDSIQLSLTWRKVFPPCVTSGCPVTSSCTCSRSPGSCRFGGVPRSPMSASSARRLPFPMRTSVSMSVKFPGVTSGCSITSGYPELSVACGGTPSGTDDGADAIQAVGTPFVKDDVRPEPRDRLPRARKAHTVNAWYVTLTLAIR